MSLYTDEILEAERRWKGILSSPSKEALKHPSGLRIFKNDLIENYVARIHPVMPGIWVTIVSSTLFSIGLRYHSVPYSIALFIVGFFAWTLVEYLLHMFLFHKAIHPSTHPKVKFFIFMLHGYHHEYPMDPDRLMMPILMAWPIATVLGLFFWLFLGSSYFFSFYGGLLVGYLAYDWLHYYEHHIQPQNRIGKYMRKFHSIHHYVDETKNFGISTPLWDWVFGKAKYFKEAQ